MLQDVECLPRNEVEIEPERRRMMEAQADAVGRRGAAAEKLRRYHGEILPLCAVFGAALTITGDGAILADGSSSRSSSPRRQGDDGVPGTHHRKLGRWLRTALVRRPKLDEFAGLIEHWLGDGRRHGCGKNSTRPGATPGNCSTCATAWCGYVCSTQPQRWSAPRRLRVILTQYCRIKSAVLWFVGGLVPYALVAVDRQDSGIRCKRRHEGSLMTNEPWVSVDDLAKHLGVAKYSVYRWIDHKGLHGSQDWTTVKGQAIGGR